MFAYNRSMKKLWNQNALVLYAILKGQVRLVGGCVRDSLCDRSFTDRDMATPLTPDEVVERLDIYEVPHLDMGRPFGTIKAKIGNEFFEITSLRKDIKTDGRHAVVEFTKSWRTDALRRDFTVNALYMDKEGKIYDYVGGLADLGHNQLRFIGKPSKRLREDYLRALRYFRFWGQMNLKEIEGSVMKALKRVVPHLKELSEERRQQELFKIIMTPHSRRVLKKMKEIGMLGPELLNVRFSKSQKEAFVQAEKEKLLESFGFSDYKKD